MIYVCTVHAVDLAVWRSGHGIHLRSRKTGYKSRQDFLGKHISAVN
jgi:hypothetical protein